MGIRGRKPSIEKALAERETFVPTGLVDGIARPADLSDGASGVWDVLLDDLTQMGVFRPADAIVLTEVCEMIVEAKRLRMAMTNPPAGWLRFEKDIDPDERVWLESDADALDALWQMSASYKRVRTAYLQTMRTLKSYIDEFGITPVARLRLGLLTLQSANLMDAFRDDDDSDIEQAASGPPTILGEFTDGS